MAANQTRLQIVDVADRLFYERGYEATSFGDIAREVNISRGNFYYHFKTKDQILEAVIDRRMRNTQDMLEKWSDEANDPVGCIGLFIRILIMNRAKILLYGCPVGTLCGELAKLDHMLLDRSGEIFVLFRDWLAGQFAAMGRVADADMLAMHLLVRSQGVATLASTFRDEQFIRREVDDMCVWLQQQVPD